MYNIYIAEKKKQREKEVEKEKKKILDYKKKFISKKEHIINILY